MFEEIHQLLLDFNNSDITKDDWRNLFSHSWKGDDDQYGYVLVDGGKIVGFLGTIFSEREVDGTIRRFCNATSWIVKPEYRNESALLVLAFLRTRNCTLTNLSPNPIATNVFTRLGFSVLNDETILRLPVPGFRVNTGCSVTADISEIETQLPDKHLRLLRDHRRYKCRHLLMTRKDGKQCYIISTRIKRKRLWFAHVHYISNLAFFVESIGPITKELCKQHRAAAIMIDKRFDETVRISLGFTYRLPNPMLFKSDVLQPSQIDNLYSELILLNI